MGAVPADPSIVDRAQDGGAILLFILSAITLTGLVLRRPTRFTTRVIRFVGRFIDDWEGVPDRPGVPGRPGLMAMVQSLRDQVTELREHRDADYRRLRRHSSQLVTLTSKVDWLMDRLPPHERWTPPTNPTPADLDDDPDAA